MFLSFFYQWAIILALQGPMKISVIIKFVTLHIRKAHME